MSFSIHTASVPVFKQMLGALSAVLQKAETYAAERKFEPGALLQARLYPDMFPLVRQVQIASDFAKSVSARLAGIEPPAYDDTEQSFAELQARIAKVLQFIDSLPAADIDAGATRDIVLQAGTPREKKFVGQAYLLHYGLPHFYFHVTTAYDILRHNGLAVGKKDFIGTY